MDCLCCVFLVRLIVIHIHSNLRVCWRWWVISPFFFFVIFLWVKFIFIVSISSSETTAENCAISAHKQTHTVTHISIFKLSASESFPNAILIDSSTALVDTQTIRSVGFSLNETEWTVEPTCWHALFCSWRAYKTVMLSLLSLSPLLLFLPSTHTQIFEYHAFSGCAFCHILPYTSINRIYSTKSWTPNTFFFFILCCCVIVVLYTIDRSEYRTAHIWLLLVLCNAFFCLMLDGYDIDRIKSRILNVRTNCLLWNYNVILKKRSGKFAHTCKTENNVSSSKCTSNVCKRWNTQDFWAKNTPYSYLACEAVHEVLNDRMRFVMYIYLTIR